MTENMIGGFNASDVEYITRSINEASTQYSMAEAELDYCDKKTQDILHEMELVQHTYHEIAHLANELRDIRKRRRIAKDAIDLLAPLIQWKNEQTAAINKLNKVLGDMRKIQNKQDSAVYYYRADNAGRMIV